MILKAFLRKKKPSDVYRLRFIKEKDGKWYYYFPQWPFKHHHLMMVAGADKLCSLLSEDGKTVDIFINTDIHYSTSDNYRLTLYKDSSTLTGGAFYNAICPHNSYDKRFIGQIWLCPVTLCVLGRYPQHILIY